MFKFLYTPKLAILATGGVRSRVVVTPFTAACSTTMTMFYRAALIRGSVIRFVVLRIEEFSVMINQDKGNVDLRVLNSGAVVKPKC